MKNILINDFDDSFWIPVINKISKKNFFIHTVIDYKTEIPKSLIENKINCNFINIKDAVKLQNLKKYSIKPVDTKFIIKHENFLSDMLARFDSDGESFSQKDKIHLIHKSVTVWFNYLKDNNIKFFFSKYAPHLFYDYIIYLCCKKLKIKTFFFQFTYFQNLQYLNNNVDNRAINLKLRGHSDKKKIKKLINSRKNSLKKSYKLSGLNYIKENKILKPNILSLIFFVSVFSLKIIKEFLSFKLNHESFYIFKKKNFKFDDKYIFTNFDFYKSKLNGLIKTFRYVKFYNNNLVNVLPKRFVFFASNHQPEASSTTEAGIKYYDQIHALKVLRKKIPTNYKILYKEHPAAFNPIKFGYQKRSTKYYKSLKKIKGLEFVDIEFDTYTLIRKSNFVATVAGQIGLECYLMNKNCVIFSNTWYSKLDNIHHVAKMNINSMTNKVNNNTKLVDILSKCLDTSIIRNRAAYLSYKKTHNKLENEINKISKYIKNNIKIL